MRLGGGGKRGERKEEGILYVLGKGAGSPEPKVLGLPLLLLLLTQAWRVAGPHPYQPAELQGSCLSTDRGPFAGTEPCGCPTFFFLVTASCLRTKHSRPVLKTRAPWPEPDLSTEQCEDPPPPPQPGHSPCIHALRRPRPRDAPRLACLMATSEGSAARTKRPHYLETVFFFSMNECILHVN